ncbi:MAG: LolA family protein [Dissulfurispiraceae bacterium]
MNKEQKIKTRRLFSLSPLALRLLPVFIILLPIAYCLSPIALTFAGVAGDDVARIQKAYENIKDIKGNFVQKSYIKDLKRTDTYSGQFFIKPPKMKWEFKGDKPQTVYITGEEILIYQKKEKQVFKTRFDRATYGQSPIALLGGFGDINKEFYVSMKKGRLILKPRTPMGIIVQIELTLSDGVFPIEALSILDTAYNKIDITLKDVVINTGLGDRMFAFTPPEDATVIQR